MEGLDVNLVSCLNFNKSHRWARDGFSDRLSIENVVLVGLDIGLHELCGNDPNRVAKSVEFAGAPLRTRTGLHTDESGLGLLKERQQGLTPETGFLDDLPGCVGANDMKRILADVDTVSDSSARLVARDESPPL